MEIKSCCVIGGGRMGRQIALNAAIHGFPTVVYDLSGAVCEDVTQWSEEYLAGRIAKGRMTEEQVVRTKQLFRVEMDLQKAVADADIVIEAVVEIEDVKRQLFRQLSDILPESTIIATNSSFMVSSTFTDDVKNPARLCNMHFYNPALVLKFVEVVQGPHTSEETGKAVYEFAKAMGKKPVWQKKEISGFVASYLYAGLADRAKFLVQNGYCTYQDVDLAMEEGYNMPMGPFRLNDLTGVDLTFDVLKRKYAETGVKPDMYDIYEEMVKQGRLGKKVGHGFYDYE